MFQLIKSLLNLLNDVICFLGCIMTIVFFLLFINGIVPYITLSGSMEPEIQTGSLCFVDTKIPYNEITKGDIVAFENVGGNMVTHRVISVTEIGLETKGDANNVSDGITVTETNFSGKTLFSIPYIGYVLNAIKRHYKEIIIIILLLGAFYIFKNKKCSVIIADYKKAV